MLKRESPQSWAVFCCILLQDKRRSLPKSSDSSRQLHFRSYIQNNRLILWIVELFKGNNKGTKSSMMELFVKIVNGTKKYSSCNFTAVIKESCNNSFRKAFAGVDFLNKMTSLQRATLLMTLTYFSGDSWLLLFNSSKIFPIEYIQNNHKLLLLLPDCNIDKIKK